jgi:hypothetical protein
MAILLEGLQEALMFFGGPITTLGLLLLLHTVLLVGTELIVHYVNLVSSLPQFVFKLLYFSLLVDDHVTPIAKLILELRLLCDAQG